MQKMHVAFFYMYMDCVCRRVRVVCRKFRTTIFALLKGQIGAECALLKVHDNRKLSIKSFFRLSPLKMDFNQVSARGLKRMMRNVMRRSAEKTHVDVVLIGHAKTFVPYNERTLEPFL